jgi:ATP-dependent DNA ligase
MADGAGARHAANLARAGAFGSRPRYTQDMARPFLPMYPTLLPRPFHHDGWVYEEKVDGYRVLAHKAGDRVRLIGRHAKDLTARFPELAAAVASLAPETLVPDGEVAVYDERLVSRFEWMRRAPRDAVASPPEACKTCFS